MAGLRAACVLIFALKAAANLFAVPDCTHVLEVPPTSVRGIRTAIQTVTSHVDCAGCNSVYTLAAANHAVALVDQSSEEHTEVVYKCRETPGPAATPTRQLQPTAPPSDNVELRRDVDDVSTVLSTYIVSAWTSTTSVLGIFNCTEPVYRQAAASPTDAADAVATSKADGVERRQATTPTESSVSAAPVATPALNSTTTVWTVVTETQTGVQTNTNYRCALTMDYILSVAATTTVLYNVTTYADTLTPQSTIICPGVGGFPLDFNSSTTSPRGTPPVTPPPSTGTATETGAAIPTPAVLDAELIVLAPDEPAAFTSVATSTLTLTDTVYQAVTVNHPGTITRVDYSCSSLPFDVTSTFPLLETVYPLTRTTLRYIRCRETVAPTAPATPGAADDDDEAPAEADVLPRQASTTSGAELAPSTSWPFHRTTYVPSPVTITAAVATTRVVYRCLAGARAGAG